GWQSQNNASSVQGAIEEILSAVTGEEIFVQGSGRTDAGVHALGQVAHFDTASRLPADKFRVILNTKLPKTVRILESSEPEGVFHARFTAMAREYWYLVKRMDEMLPFDDGRITPLHELPSLDLLNEYASCLKGTHDYTTFCSSRDECESKWRDIYESEWTQETDDYGYTVYKYRVSGNAFLYHQVRSMVGTMLEDAKIHSEKAVFCSRLESRDRSQALRTALSDGLYLARISYDEEEYQWFEEENNGRH
ncbi:MAG: tRNA pseudouridine(38-40) synthase TruA, partial [Spirochaetales bacterium]|nr:tRNA pseudouridine(38-40) synthase TruA [Candidatus Physcosoma equi]